jgi:hypothetical protein
MRILSVRKKFFRDGRVWATNYFAHAEQGVTKRCRRSLLTNSALVIRVQLRGEGGGGLRGLSH